MSHKLTFKQNLLSFRRTKIVATLGPASSSPETLDALIAAGVDVFRLNFSHGTHESHAETFKRIQEAIKRSGRHVAVLGDLCGPKIRVGHFADGPIELCEGKEITITVRKVAGTSELIPSEYEHLAKDVKAGDRILMADAGYGAALSRAGAEDIFACRHGVQHRVAVKGGRGVVRCPPA